MKILSILFFVLFLVAGATVPPPRVTQNLYFIDAHSQMDHRVDEERVISLMDHGGVYRTILASHMRRDWKDIVSFSEKNQDRILPAIRIKGKGYQHGNDYDYYSRLKRQASNKAFRAMGEVHIWHDSDGGKYREIRTDFKDRQVQEAFDIARQKGWPFIVHIEFASLSDDERTSYMEKLGAFLQANQELPIVLIHMAQLEADPVRQLLNENKNLYFMTSHASPYYQGGGKPFINMFKGRKLAPQWNTLLEEYPDRFIFAMDNVFGFFWMPERYLGKMDLWWRALSELPDDVAHTVAHGNAERLWKIAPKPDDVVIQPPWVTKESLGRVTGHATARGKK